jgi:glycogen synthase
MRQGMGQDLSWQQPAREYLQLYRTARAAKPA